MIKQLLKNRFKVLVIGCILIIAALGMLWTWNQARAVREYRQNKAAQQADGNLKYVQDFYVTDLFYP